MNFRETLKSLRTKASLTQNELGNLCEPKLSGVYISQIEKGNRTPPEDVIYRLAKALNYNVTDLTLLAKNDSIEGFEKKGIEIDKELYRETEDAIVFYRKVKKLSTEKRAELYRFLNENNIELPSDFIIRSEVNDLYKQLNLKPPINVEKILDDLSDFITYKQKKIDYSIEGYCEKTKEKINIYLNSSIDKYRKN